jgi:hypothetical protein
VPAVTCPAQDSRCLLIRHNSLRPHTRPVISLLVLELKIIHVIPLPPHTREPKTCLSDCVTEQPHRLLGAIAELFDSSCLYGTPAFDSAPTVVYDAWSAPGDLVTPQEVITTLGLLPNPAVLGQHYYVLNPVGPGLSPKWDFTSSGATAGNSNAYAVGVKVGDLPSTNSSNIDSLMVKAIEGELASEIFRVKTNGGQPPSQCTAGDSNITVKYTAQYCECAREPRGIDD